MMEWIKVSERLPERSCDVLTCKFHSGVPYIVQLPYSKVHNAFNALDHKETAEFAFEVEYWMPLPEAPRGDCLYGY